MKIKGDIVSEDSVSDSESKGECTCAVTYVPPCDWDRVRFPGTQPPTRRKKEKRKEEKRKKE